MAEGDASPQWRISCGRLKLLSLGVVLTLVALQLASILRAGRKPRGTKRFAYNKESFDEAAIFSRPSQEWDARIDSIQVLQRQLEGALGAKAAAKRPRVNNLERERTLQGFNMDYGKGPRLRQGKTPARKHLRGRPRASDEHQAAEARGPSCWQTSRPLSVETARAIATGRCANGLGIVSRARMERDWPRCRGKDAALAHGSESGEEGSQPRQDAPSAPEDFAAELMGRYAIVVAVFAEDVDAFINEQLPALAEAGASHVEHVVAYFMGWRDPWAEDGALRSDADAGAALERLSAAVSDVRSFAWHRFAWLADDALLPERGEGWRAAISAEVALQVPTVLWIGATRRESLAGISDALGVLAGKGPEHSTMLLRDAPRRTEPEEYTLPGRAVDYLAEQGVVDRASARGATYDIDTLSFTSCGGPSDRAWHGKNTVRSVLHAWQDCALTQDCALPNGIKGKPAGAATVLSALFRASGLSLERFPIPEDAAPPEDGPPPEDAAGWAD